MHTANLSKITLFLFSMLSLTCNLWASTYQLPDGKVSDKQLDLFDDKLQQHVNNTVKVVYFHGKGQSPFSGWRDRLDRTLSDVSCFYAEEFAKHGRSSEGIPFQTEEDGRIKVHVLEGQKEVSFYGIHSGAEIEREISTTLSGTIDMNNDHILVITALGYKQEEGSYVFHSPYYGRGDARSGICIVVDCDLLDVANLTDTVSRMSFSEMAVADKRCSVAEFNSWYIGGIAHEMGHLFGLPHDYGHPSERRDPTFISLMGQHGSRHYREEKWNTGKTSVFSKAGIEQLAAHPLFAKRRKPTNFTHEFLLNAYAYITGTHGSILKLNYYSSRSPAKAIALIRPIETSEYFNNSYVSSVPADTTLQFDLPLFEVEKPYEVVFLFIWPDGTTLTRRCMFTYRGNMQLVHDQNYGNTITEEWRKVLAHDRAKNRRELDIIGQLLERRMLTDLDDYPGHAVSLSDAVWQEAYVGWEVPARNYFSSESNARFFLLHNGRLYQKGLYAHSPSLYKFALNGKWKRMQVTAGLRDGAHGEGGAQFHILGDGKILASSPQLKVNETFSFDIDIANVQCLELRTNDVEGHNHNSWAIWCDPIVSR